MVLLVHLVLLVRFWQELLLILSVIHFVCHLNDVDLYLPLFMATLSITEVDILKILELILIVNLLLYLELRI